MKTIQPRDDREGRLRGRIGRKLVFTFVVLVMGIVGCTGWVLYQLTRRSLEQQMSTHLLAVAQVVAADLSRSDLLLWIEPGKEHSRLYRQLTDLLQRIKDQVGARQIFVFDRQGRSLLDTQEGVPVGREYHRLKIRDRSELEQMWKGRATHTILFPDGDELYMTGYAPIDVGSKLIAGVGVDIGAGFLDEIRTFKRSVLVFAGISVLLTLVVGLLWGRAITRPIERLVDAAGEIGRGNLQQAIATSGPDEIGYLGETMEEMRGQLLARDAQLRQMLGGVAHEIRNPLGGIEIYAGLIADDLPAEDTRKHHIQKVIGEVRTLNRVITEFLEFARPAQPIPEWTSITQVIEDVAFLLGPEMREAKVEYKQSLPAEFKAYVDPEQIKRVVLNLMKNGIQAMRQGGELHVRGTAGEGTVIIEIEDTGMGIKSEIREHLFEPFFTTKEKGSGLGLAIVRQTLEENRGKIELAAPIIGQGAVFKVTLPAHTNGRLA